VPLFANAIRGKHLASPHVVFRRSHTFQLQFEAPPLFETDGELQQAPGREVTVRVRPGALTVIA
jgi:diacylglycerol kinase family enzyme